MADNSNKKYAGNQAVTETIKALRRILGNVSSAGIEEDGNYIDGGGQSFTSALFALDKALSEKSSILNITVAQVGNNAYNSSHSYNDIAEAYRNGYAIFLNGNACDRISVDEYAVQIGVSDSYVFTSGGSQVYYTRWVFHADGTITSSRNTLDLLSCGDGTAFLSNDGTYKKPPVTQYDGIINISTSPESVYLEGASASHEVYGTSLTGYSTGLFDYLNDGILSHDEGLYKLVFGDVYVGDCIIEAIDTSKGNYRITIKRVAGSDYYFGKAQQFMLNDGEEYYNSTYFDIFLFDVNSLGGNYNKHVINHNPHKNDDLTATVTASVLSFSPERQGICKILDEYYEGCRKFDDSTDEGNKSLLPVISGDSSAHVVFNNLNSSSETSVVYLDERCYNSLTNYYLLDYYLSGLASGAAPALLQVIPKKTVHLFNDGTEKNVLIAPMMDSLQWNEGFDVKAGSYSVHLKPYEHCEIEIIAGSLESEAPDLGAPVVYAVKGFVNLKRLAPTKTSQLTNDSGFAVKTPVEIIDLGGSARTYNLGVVGWDKIIKIQNGSLMGLQIEGFEFDDVYNNDNHHEVLIEFDCGTEGMPIHRASNMVWADDKAPEFKSGYHYQLSISRWVDVANVNTYYLAVCAGFFI